MILDWRPGPEDSGLTSGECSSLGFFLDAAAVVVVLLLLVVVVPLLLLALAAEPRGLRVLTSFFVVSAASFSFSLRARVRFGLMGCGSVWLVGDPVARERRVLVSVGRASPSCRSSPSAAVAAVLLLFLRPLVVVLVFACSDDTVVRVGESDRETTSPPSSRTPTPTPTPVVTPSDPDTLGGDESPGDEEELNVFWPLSWPSSSSVDILSGLIYHLYDLKHQFLFDELFEHKGKEQ